jgi:AraC-like DNA-binding protein
MFQGAERAGWLIARGDGPLACVEPGTSTLTSALLLDLLNSAVRALTNDRRQAKHFIAKAARLVSMATGPSPHRNRTEPGNRRLAPWQTRRAIEFVEANLAETITVGDLAAVTRLSARQFTRAFRRDFGEAPYAYVVRSRIQRAKDMMLTQDSLAQISAQCGFSDQAHLTRLFRRAVGTSPGKWRRSLYSAQAMAHDAPADLHRPARTHMVS